MILNAIGNVFNAVANYINAQAQVRLELGQAEKALTTAIAAEKSATAQVHLSVARHNHTLVDQVEMQAHVAMLSAAKKKGVLSVLDLDADMPDNVIPFPSKRPASFSREDSEWVPDGLEDGEDSDQEEEEDED